MEAKIDLANRSRLASLRARPAYTLVESLVVIGIIGTLTALVFSAIQKSRDAAIRLRCQNNVRQLALAMQGHHSTIGSFPIGHHGALPQEKRPFTSWHLSLLPFLEQESLYSRGISELNSPDLSLFPRSPTSVFSTPVLAFSCPSDDRTSLQQLSARRRYWAGLTSYLGVSGLDHTTLDGALIPNLAISISAITDGASNTLLLGERPPSPDLEYGWWFQGAGQDPSGSGSVNAILGVAEKNVLPASEADCGPGPYAFAAGNMSVMCDMLHFWSPHFGGANFAFCDGSVRFLRYSSASIMPLLASRAGGEAVAID